MKHVLKLTSIGILMVGLLSCLNGNATKEENNLAMHEPVSLSSEKPNIQVALLLDTSNSMDGLIDQAKAQLWEIINELSYAKCYGNRPNLQIAIYEYGNDNLKADTGYIRQVLSFSNDLDQISKELFSLTTNGGNEFCGYAIDTSLKQLKWASNKNDLKLIFIAGNEPFTQGNINYKDASMDANEKNISVNTIYCGDYNQGISSYWKDAADITKGNYMAINHNQTTVYIASPYDEKILELNTVLNKTYIAYGTQGRQKMQVQNEQDSNALGYGDANAVSRAVSKSSYLYTNETWDLVDASSDKTFDYSSIKIKDLPENLKGMSKSSLKNYVEGKRQERQTIQKEIQNLNIKRKNYISKKDSTASNNLENAMINAIKEQAKLKNYRW